MNKETYRYKVMYRTIDRFSKTGKKSWEILADFRTKDRRAA